MTGTSPIQETNHSKTAAAVLSLALAFFPGRATAQSDITFSENPGNVAVPEVAAEQPAQTLEEAIIDSSAQLISIGQNPFSIDEIVSLTKFMQNHKDFKLILCDAENSGLVALKGETEVKEFIKEAFPGKFAAGDKYVILTHIGGNDSLYSAASYIDGSNNQATAPLLRESGDLSIVLKSLDSAIDAHNKNDTTNVVVLVSRAVVNAAVFYLAYRTFSDKR